QQRGIVIDIHVMVRAVNNEANHKLVYFLPQELANSRASGNSMPSAPNSGPHFGERISANAKFVMAIFHDKSPDGLGHPLQHRFSYPKRAIKRAVLNSFADVFGRDGVH